MRVATCSRGGSFAASQMVFHLQFEHCATHDGSIEGSQLFERARVS